MSNLAPPTQDVVPSDEDEEYYEYYDEENPNQQGDEEYEYYEEEDNGDYEYYDEPEPDQEAPASRPKPPPPKAKPKPPAATTNETAAAQADDEDYEYYEDEPAGDGDGDTEMTVPAAKAPPRIDTSHLMVEPLQRETKKDKDGGIICCGMTYCCCLCIAFIIALFALIIAIIPLILYMNKHGIDALAGSSDAAEVDDTIYYHHHDIKQIKPDFNFIFAELGEIEAESWGDNFTQDWYIGTTYRGWEYRSTWDFNFNDRGTDNGRDPPGSETPGGWAQGNNQERLYPLSDIRANYGDRLIFRTWDSYTVDEADCWLVPKEIYDSCNFSVDNNTYWDYYFDANDDLIMNSSLLMFEPYTTYTIKDNVSFADFNAWNQFVFEIKDNSHLLPCDDDDLYCNLITDDTLYFISSYRWDRDSGYGSNNWCKGDFWDQGGRGLGQIVYIDGYRSHLPTVEADPNALLDPETVQDLQYAIATVGRTMILSQFNEEQRIRSEGHSGFTNVRGRYDGDAVYDDGTYTNGAVASIHDHADNIIVVGIGEIQAVLNGVEFRTRHNDYNLNMPSTTSTEYGATEPIPYPDVPPEVENAGDVTAQIAEMQEWFRAFKTQNKTHRNYTDYFKPILCYLEGTWVLDDDQLEEPFDSDRHFIDAKSWKQLHDKIRWMANSGRKNSAENLAHLPSAIRNLVNDTFPIVSNWEYRILCSPLKNDIPTSRFRIADDLSVQLMGSPLTRDELLYSRRARFQLNTYVNLNDIDGDHQWESARTRWNYWDYLMEQIPGKDNYPANLTDELPDGSGGVVHHEFEETLNIGYYNRYYRMVEDDAMGTSRHRRGWADRWLFAAKTTSTKVSPIEFDFEMEDEDGNEAYYPTISRWSYAIPLEIIYQTPLTQWNPYNIVFHERDDYDYDRSGGCETNTAYDGWTTNNAYFTPEEFFNGITTTSSADTANGAVCALDSDGNVQSVMASGHWITFPEISNEVGYVRQRYPIFPIHTDGYPGYKEIKALEDVTIADDYDDPVLGVEFFGDSRDLEYGFNVYLQGGGHQHEVYISGYKIEKYWFDDTLNPLNGSSFMIEVDSEERNGHTHTLNIYRQRSDDDSEWVYKIDTCRFGSIGDDENVYPSMDNLCADNHNVIVR